MSMSHQASVRDPIASVLAAIAVSLATQGGCAAATTPVGTAGTTTPASIHTSSNVTLTPGPCPATSSCVGTIEAPTELAPSEDAALLASAIGAPGEGKLCSGAVFQVMATVHVYRLYGGPARDLGRWWSFTRPMGDAPSYRSANAICASWNDLAQLNECELPLATSVVVGTGQSVSCDEGCFGSSVVNQVFVPNPAVLQACRSTTWPAEMGE